VSGKRHPNPHPHPNPDPTPNPDPYRNRNPNPNLMFGMGPARQLGRQLLTPTLTLRIPNPNSNPTRDQVGAHQDAREQDAGGLRVARVARAELAREVGRAGTYVVYLALLSTIVPIMSTCHLLCLTYLLTR